MAEWYEAKQLKGLFPPSVQAALSPIEALPAKLESKRGGAWCPVPENSEEVRANEVRVNKTRIDPKTNRRALYGCGCLLMPFGLGIIFALIGAIRGAVDPEYRERIAKEQAAAQRLKDIAKYSGVVKYAQQIDCCAPLIDDLTFNAQKVAGKVHTMASDHPYASKAEVTLSLYVAGGISDKYGKALPNPCPMGVLIIENLDEVRKYRDADAYRLNPSNTQFYKSKLRAMQGGHLLE